MSERIPLFPLPSLLLPHTDLGLHVFEDRYRALVADSLNDGYTFGIVLTRGDGEPYEVGTLAHIAGYARLPDGRYLLEVEGSRRFRIHTVETKGQYPAAAVDWLSESIGNFAAARDVCSRVEGLVFIYRSLDGNADFPVRLSVDPVARSYQVAALLEIDSGEKQSLLEIPTATDRLEAEVEILTREIAHLDQLRTGQR